MNVDDSHAYATTSQQYKAHVTAQYTRPLRQRCKYPDDKATFLPKTHVDNG